MELSKQLKIIDRKFAYNTGKLPGFEGGHISPYQMVMQNGGFTNQLKNQVAGEVNIRPNDKETINRLTPNTGGQSQAVNAAAAIGPWFAAGAWLGGGVLEGINAAKKSTDEYLADAGTRLASIAGIGYTAQNNVDVGKIMKEYNDEATSSLLNNPGKAVAMFLGADGARESARRALLLALHKNAFERGAAISKSLQLKNAKLYGDQYDLIMYAKDGKLPKYKEGLVSGEANAKVSNGEFIAREITPGQFIGYRVPGPKNNKDGRLAHLEPEDYVISNKNGSSDIAASGDIVGAINNMLATGNPSYKCGKLPRFAEGWAGNFIPAMLGTAASLEQLLSAYRNKPHKPNSYASNPYETEGLTTLAGLRVNPYPIMNQLRSAEARTNRAVDIAGGLSGGQRTAARLAALNTTQTNISNLLSNILTQNNAYKSAYAQAALTAGQQSRAARMSANQWDYDMYAKAHAARNKGIQTGIANMLAQIQQYQANEFKRRQFNETMDLYRADQKQRNEQNAWMRNYYANQPTSYSTRGVAPNPTKYDPVNPYTPIAPEPIKKYPWDYDRSLDYWNNLMNNRKGGLWR